MDVGKIIRQKREERKLTQTHIADIIGLDTSSYARIEKKGNKLSVEQLQGIAGALGVTVVELLTGEPQTGQTDERVKELQLLVDYWKELAETRNERIKLMQRQLEGYKEACLNNLFNLISHFYEDNGSRFREEDWKPTEKNLIPELPSDALRYLYMNYILTNSPINYAIYHGLLESGTEVLRKYQLEFEREVFRQHKEFGHDIEGKLINPNE